MSATELDSSAAGVVAAGAGAGAPVLFADGVADAFVAGLAAVPLDTGGAWRDMTWSRRDRIAVAVWFVRLLRSCCLAFSISASATSSFCSSIWIFMLAFACCCWIVRISLRAFSNSSYCSSRACFSFCHLLDKSSLFFFNTSRVFVSVLFCARALVKFFSLSCTRPLSRLRDKSCVSDLSLARVNARISSVRFFTVSSRFFDVTFR
mmetsp:Transcript_15046/g.28779  ORF Transcript_15046/g.28779 Transcript_15046/m.28779 type:complete len:206 (+) Transcript_15046:411-1028(+)